MNGRIFARIVFAVGLGSVLLTVASCVRETAGHCVFENGDATCEEAFPGTFCIFQGPEFLDFAKEEYRNVSEAQRLGCYESPPMMDGTQGERSMFPEYYVCVHEKLDEEDEWRRHLRWLDNGKNRHGDYTFEQFLLDHKVALGADCPPNMGTTTTDTSDSSTGTTGMESSTTVGESSESSTTGPMLCTRNEDCTEIEAPQCVDGACRACIEAGGGDAACAELDETRPLCAGGTCVQCTPESPVECDEQRLVCDGSTGSCVPCTEHAECSSGACELRVGLCFPANALRLEVDGDAMMPMKPLYGTIQGAISAIEAMDGTHGVIVVHGRGTMGQSPYLESTQVDGGKTIALLAAPDESPVIQGDGGPGLRASQPETNLYMDGLSLRSNTGDAPAGRGLRIDSNAFAWVDRSSIIGNDGGGIRVDTGAVLTLRNCFVGGNGVGGLGSYGIDVNGANVQAFYSTIARNEEDGADSIHCLNATVSIRNSIVVGRDPNSIDCPGIIITNSALDEDFGTNTNVGAADLSWFSGGTTGDFHLTPAGAKVFAEIALWQTGDPTADIDGDPRQAIDGTPDYAGADVP